MRALALLYEKQKRYPEAARLAEQLVERFPKEQAFQELARRLRDRATNKPAAP